MEILETEIFRFDNEIKQEAILRKVLIINGSGGVGKDTLVNIFQAFIPTNHISIVQPAKNAARCVGWNGKKTEKDRKFLSDLKTLIDEYNNYNYKYVANIAKDFLKIKSDKEKCNRLLCIDMREKPQIEQARKDFDAKVVLVTNNRVKHITSNIADGGVFDIDYDYTIDNSGTLQELHEKAGIFLKELFKGD